MVQSLQPRHQLDGRTDKRTKDPSQNTPTQKVPMYQKLRQGKAIRNPRRSYCILVTNKAKCALWSGGTPEVNQGGWVEINHTHTAVEMAHKYASEHGKKEVTLPEEFKHHKALFSDKEVNKFPPSRTWDHKIELTENAPVKFNCKIYPLLLKEQQEEDKFLDENLAKGYIIPSDSPYGFSTFMVPKKDTKELHYIIDYRPLNAVTRRDVTPLPNLSQCIEDLQGMEVFSKFNIH